MNKYILALVLVAAVGVIVSQAGVVNDPDANEYDYLAEDEVLSEEEERALREGDEANACELSRPSIIERFERFHVQILSKSDEEETAGLNADEEGYEKYKDFCLKTRDDVASWIKEAFNEKASAALRVGGAIFFDTATLFGTEGSKAVEEGAKMVKQDARKFIEGLQLILNVLKDTILSRNKDVVANFENSVNMDTFKELMQDACTAVGRKKQEIDSRFRSINKNGSKNWAKLDCVTLKRMKISDRICSVILVLSPLMNDFMD